MGDDEAANTGGSRFNVALIIVELVRLLMDVLDWWERRKLAKSDDRPLPKTFEVYEIKCYQCDQPTSAFVAATGALLPPVMCESCVIGPDSELTEE